MSKRILVTGSRDWDDWQTLAKALFEEANDNYYAGVVVVHGACPTGADYGAGWITRNLLCYTENGAVEDPHPAKWREGGLFDSGAGFKRNLEMVALGADVCLAFFKEGAPNKGTAHCASAAEKAGIPVRRFYA